MHRGEHPGILTVSESSRANSISSLASTNMALISSTASDVLTPPDDEADEDMPCCWPEMYGVCHPAWAKDSTMTADLVNGYAMTDLSLAAATMRQPRVGSTILARWRSYLVKAIGV